MEKETMSKLKTLTMIVMLAMVISFGAPQAFAGEMQNGVAGPTETPGLNGTIHTGSTGQVDVPPAANGQMETTLQSGEISGPGVTGDTQFPGAYGWIGTGLYAAIASLFG